MSYERAIKGRKEELKVMEKALKEAEGKERISDLQKRVEFLKSAIKGLEKLKELG